MAEYKGELFDVPPKVAESIPPPVTESVLNPVAESVSAPVSETVATPVLAAPSGVAAMDKTFAESTQQLQKDYRKKVDETTTSNVNVGGNEFNLPSFFTSPAGYVAGLGGAALLGGAAVKYVPPLITKAKDMANRWLSSPAGMQQAAQMAEVADPSFASSTAAPMQDLADYEPSMSRTAAPSQNLTIEEAKARMAGVTPAPTVAPAAAPVVPEAAAPAMVEAPKPVAPSAAPNSPVTQAVSETITDMVQAETPQVAPARPITPTPAAALPVAPPTGELKTGSGLTAYPGQGKPKERFPKEFKTVADIPAGYAFVPGMGPGTNVIRNTYTPEGYNALIQERQVPFGSDVETRAFMKQYDEQRVGPPASRELRKSLGLPMPQNTTGVPMRKAVVGGIAGAVLAIPDLANAAQNRDVGQAAEVGSGFLPPALQALTYAKGAGEGETAELDRQRRMQAYALQAGRGVSQGYDPRRLVGVAPPMR
jgi:hypothetical protein